MIIPRRHIRSLKELSQTEWDTIRTFSYIAKKMIREVYGIKGMQLVFKDGADAQSTVDQHLHFHCIPFDAPDLAVWNYRKLQHTPLENVARYREHAKRFAQHDARFAGKYTNANRLPIICDAILFNTKDEILFQERAQHLKFVPDIMTIPGGRVTDFDVPLEHELAREVREETGLAVDVARFNLVASRISSLVRTRHEAHIGMRYPVPETFMLNTYVYARPISEREMLDMVPGDDCAQFVWVSRVDVAHHPRISDEIKKTIRMATV
jgi:diadenosine tetraphosphate (Ap4A) HIT family hydrolase/ADP-ribose pyrophosphatase YjhB (NUDIX family)